VIHTYSAAGIYAVTLTVTDNGGATGTQSNSITVIRRK
jgi:PKD repeat protein